MIFTILGFIAIAVMNGSAIPQIIKIIKTKKVRDLHAGRDLMLLTGCTIYLIYAIHRVDPVVIASNVWGILSFITIIYLEIKYGYTRGKTLVQNLKRIFSFGRQEV